MSTPKYTVAEMTGYLIDLAPAFIAVADEKGLSAEDLMLSFVGDEAAPEQIAGAIRHARFGA